MKDSKRYRLYQLVDVLDISGNGEIDFDYYDFFMMIVIAISLFPLAFKEETPILHAIEIITFIIFLVDYFLRWIIADYHYNDMSIQSFIRYPFSFMAIVDLLSMLPTIISINPGFRVLKIFRFLKAFRMFRVVKAMRYSKSIMIIMDVFQDSKEPLLAVAGLSFGYILVSALIIFNAEPHSFANYYEAIYWSTISLTTVGYGDLYPTTTIGRTIAMLSSIFGIAIVALPSGIITAGYMAELNKRKTSDE